MVRVLSHANIRPWLEKSFKFKVSSFQIFKSLENAFCETPSPLVSSDH